MCERHLMVNWDDVQPAKRGARSDDVTQTPIKTLIWYANVGEWSRADALFWLIRQLPAAKDGFRLRYCVFGAIRTITYRQFALVPRGNMLPSQSLFAFFQCKSKMECFCFACDMKCIVNMYSNNMTNVQQGITQCLDGHYASLTSIWKILNDSDDLTKSNQEAGMEVESEELNNRFYHWELSWMLCRPDRYERNKKFLSLNIIIQERIFRAYDPWKPSVLQTPTPPIKLKSYLN